MRLTGFATTTHEPGRRWRRTVAKHEVTIRLRHSKIIQLQDAKTVQRMLYSIVKTMVLETL